MKILELRFKNLNSLYGEWFIDFTDPEYTSNGIFALTGSTGAGKSTILDAICLALYGATPRLGKITKSSNEIMSRQTGECYAEVMFESQAGRFRCHWGQHRARKKADGNLVDSKHEIADAVSGQILESKKRDVANVIEEKTGMDFDRFTRSILLAQGGFAVFLQAAPDERAPILEQITGTEIYSEISKRIHERQWNEREKLKFLKAKTDEIVFLSDDQESELMDELAEKQKSEKEISLKEQEINKSIQWLTGIDSLRNETADITKEADKILKSIESLKTEREKLHNAQKAAELEGEFVALSLKRQQQESDLKSLTKDEEQIPQLEDSLKQKEDALKNAEKVIVMVRNEQKFQLEIIKKVRALDLHITEKDKALETAKSDYKRIEKQVSENKSKRQKALDEQKSALKKLEQIQKYQTTNAGDEALISQLSIITEQINNLKSESDEISLKKSIVKKQQKQAEEGFNFYQTQQIHFNDQKKVYDLIVQQVSEANDTLKMHLGDRLLREYRAEQEGLVREMIYLKKISNLEEERKKLKDGTPCPLCGSKKHPFAEGNVPEIDETEKQINELNEFIKKAEQLESNIKELEKNEKETSSKLIKAEKLLTEAMHKKDESEKNLKRLKDELTGATEQFTTLLKVALLKLQPFGITELSQNKFKSILSTLNDRFKKWQDYQIKKSETEKKNNELASEINGLNGIIETIGNSLKEKQDTINALKEDFEQLVHKRKEMYNTKNPDDEEARLERQVSKAEKLEKAERESHEQVRRQKDEVKTRISTLKKNIDDRKPELESLELKFIGKCTIAGFDDEQSFVANRLSSDERNRLSQQLRELDEKQADILTRKKDREDRLALEIEKKITGLSLEDLKKDLEKTEESLKKIGEEIGAMKQRLSDNKDAKVRFREKQILVDAQRNECTRWDKLHSLIGSADGKKYRNFAQGLTFELMVSHANRQLEKMTDRYLLIRDDEQPLELNVIDNYQAGEIRSTKNLSGGESFIVSLSLALGLSKMASRKVRVDSLFLDEGFGTLDDEALETALETLAELQQDGKLIGVISHVSALKERISTQINVLPISGGKSTVSGPGCKRIDHVGI